MGSELCMPPPQASISSSAGGCYHEAVGINSRKGISWRCSPGLGLGERSCLRPGLELGALASRRLELCATG
jgi:hypothetical protein